MPSAAGRYDFGVNPDNLNTTYGRIIAQIPRGSEVLDIGCAAGGLGLALESLSNCRVLGIDLDSEAVAVARERGLEAIAADVTVGSLKRLFGERRFDVVVLADVLEHLVHPAALLARVAGVLLPAGVVIASFPNITHVDVQMMLAQEEWRYEPTGILDRTHLRFFTLASFSEMAMEAGFRTDATFRVVAEPLGTSVLAHGRRVQLPPAVVEQFRVLAAQRPSATVYQYVVELRPDSGTDPQVVLEGTTENAQPVARADGPPRLDVVIVARQGGAPQLRDQLYSLAGVEGAAVRALVIVDREGDLEPTRAFVTPFRDMLQIAVETASDASPLERGLELAEAEYVAFLGPNDLVYPTFARRLLGTLETTPAVGVFGDTQVEVGDTQEQGFVARARGPLLGEGVERYDFFVRDCVPICSFAFRLSQVQQAGIAFDSTLGEACEWGFLCALAARFDMVHVGAPVAVRRVTDRRATVTTPAERSAFNAARAAVLSSLAGQPVRATVAEMVLIGERLESVTLELAAKSVEVEVARMLGAQLLASRSWRWTRFLRRWAGSKLPT